MTKRRPNSRIPFDIEAQGLLAQNINAPTWIHNTWKESWTKKIHVFILSFRFFRSFAGPSLTGHELSRSAWVRLNRLRTGIGRFGSLIYRWGLQLGAQPGGPRCLTPLWSHIRLCTKQAIA